MIETPTFYNALIEKGWDTFFGVPDSLLKDICAYITEKASRANHIITANEGNAVGLASGHYLATGKPAIVYLQNSGLGNTINPLLSLADKAVYKIPMILMIGWRGEPGVKDEPQHVTQGRLTESLLDTLEIPYRILSEHYQEDLDQLERWIQENGKPVALLVRKNTFSPYKLEQPKSKYNLSREEALKVLLKTIEPNAMVVSTTGKTSREIFEIREKKHQDHAHDFLTVGAMGHTSSIALGLALKTTRPVYCIDGDGSMLMHMGGLAITGQYAPGNLRYIVINNGAHESVGAQPTVAYELNLFEILKNVGFNYVYEASNQEDLDKFLGHFQKLSKSALIINVKTGSRADLGRPTQSPQENKHALMSLLAKDKT